MGTLSHNNSDLVSCKFDFMNFSRIYKSTQTLSASHLCLLYLNFRFISYNVINMHISYWIKTVLGWARCYCGYRCL